MYEVRRREGSRHKSARVYGSDELAKKVERKRLRNFWFHHLRHTFASWYMMNGGDLYEFAELLGHSNIKMTERYAKLGRTHIIKTGTTAKVLWSMMESKPVEQGAVQVGKFA